MRPVVLVVLLAAACGGGRAPAPARPDPVADAPPSLDDEGFRTMAREVAARSARYIAGWGTLRLDGTATPYRFATLEPIEVDGRGAYLLEQAPGQLWLLDFYQDGRATIFLGGDGTRPATEPAWTTRHETAITHGQGHRAGGESFSFGLRGGALVLLQYDFTNDARTPDPSLDRAVRYVAADGSCAECPPVAGYTFEDTQLRVRGPAATVDELVAAPAK